MNVVEFAEYLVKSIVKEPDLIKVSVNLTKVFPVLSSE